MSAYNAEKTINRAIDSVFKQNYSNIELIVVNDCSTDNTESIVKSYNDDRIVLINHEVNLGAGCARDTGVKNCTGDYIKFLDSDDYLSEDAINKYVQCVLEYKADILVDGYIIEDTNCNVLEIRKPKTIIIETGDDRFTPDVNECKRFLTLFFIKKSLFDTITYSHRRYCEDTPTLFKLIYLCNKLVQIPYAGYHYTQNDWSLIHTASKLKSKIYSVLAAIDNTLFLRERGEEMNDNLVLTMYDFLKDYTEEDLLEFPEEMKEINTFLKTIKYGN